MLCRRLGTAVAVAAIAHATGCSGGDEQARTDGTGAAGGGGFGAAGGAGGTTGGSGGTGGETSAGGGGSDPGEPLIVTAGYGGRRMRSLDLGLSWIDHVEDDPDGGDDQNLLRDVTFADGLFVAVGWRIHTTSDGVTWDERTVSGQQWCGGVAYGNGRFLCVGGCGNSYRSSDGITWEAAGNATSGGCMHMRSLAFGNGVFVSAGDNGLVNRTTDGEDWEAVATDEGIDRVIFRDGQFIGHAGGGGSHKTSDDGVTWTDQAGDAQMEAMGHGVYLRGQWKGSIERSTDGTSWTNVLDDDGNHLTSFAFGFVAR